MHKKGLRADCGLRTQHRVTQSEGRRLAYVDAGGIRGQHASDLVQQIALALRLQQLLEFRVRIEVILNGALGCAGDEYQAPRTGGQGLLDGVLDERLVDDGQHLLGTRLGRRQKPRAAPGHGKHRGTNHGFYSAFPNTFWHRSIRPKERVPPHQCARPI